MNQLLPIIAVAALASLQNVALASSRALSDTIDNEIPVNDPIPAQDGRRVFVDIEKGPTSTHHSAGAVTELICQAIGHPAPHIQWLKNDMPILEDEPETNEIIDETTTSLANVRSALYITAVSTNKEDVYTCVAKSATKTAVASAKVYNEVESLPSMYSSIASLNRHLLLAPQKPRISQFTKTYMADVNTNIVLPCRVFGNPLPEVEWFDAYKNPILNKENRIRVLESGELVFTPVVWEDMGGYTCTAKNAYGKDSITTFLYPVLNERQKYHWSHRRPH